MVTVRDVNAMKLVSEAKEELKKVQEIKPPAWMAYAKSGTNRQRAPKQSDFWYVRGASILRRIYIDGPIGTEKLKSYYGGRKRRGTKPAKFRKSSGSIIRKLLQQLESAGLVNKNKDGGREVSAKGRKMLDNIAGRVVKS